MTVRPAWQDTAETLLAEATPGPWGKAYWPDPEPYHWVGQHDPNPLASRMRGQVTGPVAEGDAAFIAAARSLVPLLVNVAKAAEEVADWQMHPPMGRAGLRRATQARAELEAALAELRAWGGGES